MKASVSRSIAVAVAFILVSPWFAAADQMGGQDGDRRMERRSPPKEAIDACTGKESRAFGTFTGPNGTVGGTCHRVPEGYFACVPGDRMEGRGGSTGEMPDSRGR